MSCLRKPRGRMPRLLRKDAAQLSACKRHKGSQRRRRQLRSWVGAVPKFTTCRSGSTEILRWGMLRIPRFLTKNEPVPAVDERLLKLLVEDVWRLSHADFDFCVDCLTASAAWRAVLLRLAEERRRLADSPPEAVHG